MASEIAKKLFIFSIGFSLFFQLFKNIATVNLGVTPAQNVTVSLVNTSSGGLASFFAGILPGTMSLMVAPGFNFFVDVVQSAMFSAIITLPFAFFSFLVNRFLSSNVAPVGIPTIDFYTLARIFFVLTLINLFAKPWELIYYLTQIPVIGYPLGMGFAMMYLIGAISLFFSFIP